MKFSAVIFDLDGTVIDSEGAWGKAFLLVLKSIGVNTGDAHPSTAGVSVKENWKLIISKYGIKTSKTLDELRSLTYREYRKLIGEIQIMDGAIEFIENLRESGVLIGLATSTAWETADDILKNLKIEDLFDAITTGEETPFPKPDPGIFLVAAGKMNVEPEACLVIEDSGSGVIAGKEAGMKVIAISKDEDSSQKLEKADLIVEGFLEITPKVIAEI